MKIAIQEIRHLLENKLKKIGFTARESRIIVDEYVTGELKGKQSHGVFGFIRDYRKISGDERYAESKGDLRLFRKIHRGHFRVIKNHIGYAYINGKHDIGQLVADRAIKLAIDKSRKNGIAMVGGGNINAFLRPGTWAEKAAQQGMIALCFNYGGGPLMAPTGAREPILSTNPIGIGIPFKPFPIVIDMATSERAYYHVRLAKELGKKIPGHWAIDSAGRPTTDPNRVAAVLPLGGYKGYALALALEILTGPLVRTVVGKSTKLLRGFLFIVINPLAFTTRPKFNAGVKRLIRDVKTAKRIKGVKSIHVPGEQSWAIEQKNLKSGYLNIDGKIIDAIQKL